MINFLEAFTSSVKMYPNPVKNTLQYFRSRSIES